MYLSLLPWITFLEVPLASYKADTAPKFSIMFFDANTQGTVPASLSSLLLIHRVGVSKKESTPEAQGFMGVKKGKKTEEEKKTEIKMKIRTTDRDRKGSSVDKNIGCTSRGPQFS